LRGWLGEHNSGVGDVHDVLRALGPHLPRPSSSPCNPGHNLLEKRAFAMAITRTIRVA